MTETGFTDVDVKPVGDTDEVRVYTVKYVLSEFAQRVAVNPYEWPVDYPEELDLSLKYYGPICNYLVNEIVKNIKGIDFIVVDSSSITIIRHMNSEWSEIEPKIFKAIEKALKVKSKYLGVQRP